MYKISAPISINTVTKENREEYLSCLKKCGITRIFLCGGLRFANEMEEERLLGLSEHIRFFSENGIEAFIWISSVGHGIVLSHELRTSDERGFTQMINAEGDPLHDAYCPLDPSFREKISASVSRLARSGAKVIMLDDDFRMSQRGGGLSSICCCCERHLSYMSELCGEPVTLETVKNQVLCGEKNKYRDAWLRAQGEGLRMLAKDIRRAVDEVDESVCVALCSAWCNWDIDGADALELAGILAGKNKPVLRLHGAPYWQKFGMYESTPISVSELERMLNSFCAETDVELFSEGDTYPRPRFNVPAAHLEVFDAMQRATSEISGILKYMFDYVALPNYESGYVKAHIKNLPSFQRLSEEFDGTQAVGVRIYTYPHMLKDADIAKNSVETLSITPYASGAFLAENGIPTVYNGDGICACVLGYNALAVPLSALKNGAIIDSTAAKILMRRGVDVGIESVTGELITCVSREIYGQTIAPVNENCRLLSFSAKAGAEPISKTVIDGNEVITSYRYENGNGQKFFVMCFDHATVFHGMRLSYLRRQSLKDAVEWISGKKLVAFCENAPYVYTVVKKHGEKTRIALFNCFEDEIIEPVVTLDREYSSVRFIKGSGSLCGDKVVFNEDIGAYKYVAFEIE